MIVKRIYFILGCIFLTHSCSVNGDFEESTRFSDKSVQLIFIQQLEDAGIDFRVDEFGYVWYPYDNKHEAEKISRHIIKNEYPATSTFFTDIEYANLYESMLINNDIEFKKDVRSGDIYFIWDEKYDIEAKKIASKVSELYKENEIRKFLKERSKNGSR